MRETKTITPELVAELFKEELSDYVKNKIKEYDFKYEEMAESERDGWLKKIVEVLLDEVVIKAGQHRLNQWDDGWGANLAKFKATKNLESLNPGYHGKYPVLRLKQQFIKPLSEGFERNSLYLIEDWLFDKYLRKAETIYEFGCGTGHNLFHLRQINPAARLYGLDWSASSQKIMEEVKQAGLDTNIYGRQFDFFHPDFNFALRPNAYVYTVAALEQIGDKFLPWLDYLRSNKPKLCFHIEPLAEFLDPNNLLDCLSLAYFKKRNYLSGYAAHLKALAATGEIVIMEAKRSYIGSLFIDGYSVMVWRFI